MKQKRSRLSVCSMHTEVEKRAQGHTDKPICGDKRRRKTAVGLWFHLFLSEDTIH